MEFPERHRALRDSQSSFSVRSMRPIRLELYFHLPWIPLLPPRPVWQASNLPLPLRSHPSGLRVQTCKRRGVRFQKRPAWVGYYSSASYAEVVARVYGAKLSKTIASRFTDDDWIVVTADSTAVTSGFSYFMGFVSSL